jgi:hypothetical protein
LKGEKSFEKLKFKTLVSYLSLRSRRLLIIEWSRHNFSCKNVFMNVQIHDNLLPDLREAEQKEHDDMNTMKPNETSTDILIRVAKGQVEDGNLSDAVLRELQCRYGYHKCPPEDKTAIAELDRLVLTPHFGFSKLPVEPIPIPGGRHPPAPTPAYYQKEQPKDLNDPNGSAESQTSSPGRVVRQQMEDKIPSTFQELFIRAIWHSRFKWPIVIVVLIVVVFKVLPNDIQVKFWDRLVKLFL